MNRFTEGHYGYGKFEDVETLDDRTNHQILADVINAITSPIIDGRDDMTKEDKEAIEWIRNSPRLRNYFFNAIEAALANPETGSIDGIF